MPTTTLDGTTEEYHWMERLQLSIVDEAHYGDVARGVTRAFVLGR